MRALVNLAAALTLALTVPVAAQSQSGSIAVRSLTITPEGEEFRSFAGQPYVFTPGADNTLVVNPPPSFESRTAKVSAVLDYGFDVGSDATSTGAWVSCGFTVKTGPNEESPPATAFALVVDRGQTAGSAAGFVGEGEMQLSEGIDREYTFTCRVADTQRMAALAEAPISVRQRYEPIDLLRILSVDPPTSQPLTPGSTQTFTAVVEYTLDTIRLGRLLMLVATDSSGAEILERDSLRRTNGAVTISSTRDPVTAEVTLTDVPVPEDGFVALHAEQVNTRQFGDFAPAEFATYNRSDPFIYGQPAAADYTILHIEVNQAVQGNQNAIPLVAYKPAVARVFVKTTGPRGDAIVPVRATLRKDGMERTVQGRAVTARASDDASLFAERRLRTAAEFPIPQEMLGPGTLEIDAVANLVNGEPQVSEAVIDNNAASQTFELVERDTLAIGYLAPPDFTEPATAEMIGKLFPLSPTRGLAYIPEAVYSVDDDDLDDVNRGNVQRIILEAAIAAASGLYDVLVLWDTPGSTLGLGGRRLAQAVTNGRFSRAFDDPKRSDQTALAASVAKTLLRSDQLGCLPAADDALGAVGWDTAASQLIRLEGREDLLSTCAGPRWISPDTYVRLFLRDFRANPARLSEERPTQAVQELAVVSGTVATGGSGSLAPVTRFPGADAPPLDSAGTHCVRGLSAGGALEHCFTPDVAAGGSVPFAVVFPADAVSGGVELTSDGSVVASLSPSASPPTVAITSPNDGMTIDAANPFRIAWSAADPDGDPVSVTLLISGDGGSTFTALAADRTGDSYEADFSTSAGGDQVVLRAVASDGLRTAFDEVGPFTVVQRPAMSVASSVDLGPAAAGVPATVFIPIDVSGSGRLTIETIASDNPAFEPATAAPATFLPGFPAGIMVTVTPPSPGTHSAGLTLETNAPDSPEVSVRLTVEGLDPDQPILDVSEDRMEFPEVPVGKSAQATLSLLNRGRAVLTYQATVQGDGFELAPSAAASVKGAAQGSTILQAGAQEELTVLFTPSSRGDKSGSVTITSDAPNLASTTVELFGSAAEASAAPAINTGGIVNAASFAPSLSRGAIASLFGTNLARQTVLATDTPLPTLLGGTSVEVDGAPAPLFFVSESQINFQVPFGSVLNGTGSVVVSTPSGGSSTAVVNLSPYAPGVFANPATGEPIVTLADGALIDAAAPARPGDVLIVYLTGIGDLTATPPNGEPSGSDPLSAASAPPAVTAAGSAAEVFFAGLTPGFVGLAQLNIRLPQDLSSAGDVVELVIMFPGGGSTAVDLPFSSP